MNLLSAEIEKEYTILKVDTRDEEMRSFLFTLGCFEDQKITVINKRKSGMIVAIKDGRYSIDNQLASAILVK